MAMTYQNFASLGVNLNRQKYGPLDISNVFTSAADLKYYLTKGTFTEGVSEYWYKNANEKIVPYPYEGQVLATVIDGVVSVYALALDAEGNFTTQEIGAKIETDDKTIKLVDGKLELVGLPEVTTGKTFVPSLINGVLTWAEPDTSTAEGQQQAIDGLTTRMVSVEETINGKPESSEGAGDAVVGLVDKVAALEAVDNATQAELDAYKEVVTGAIADALQAAKDYADANDADTVYDDTALAARVKALEDEERYDDTELAGRVSANEEAIADLEEAVDGVSDAVTTEKERAEAAEKALGERIDAIDFIDADELADAIKDFATDSELEDGLALKADKTALEELAATVDAFLTGDGTEAALDSLKELIEYIKTHDDVEISSILADIQAIEDKLAGIDSTVAAYVTAAIDALKIGDYAKAADLTALAGRVEALEAKPFDTYATKTEVQNVDAKFANYTTTDTLTTQLADKADADKVVANDTFEAFKTANTAAIEAAQSAAVAAAKTETETQVGVLEESVAETYATKDELGEAVDGIENDLLAYAKTADVNAELAKKIESGSIAHSSESLAEGVTVEGTKLNIVVDAYTKQEVRDYVADVIEDMTGGESAADVLLALNNHIATYEEKVGQIDAKDAAQDTAIATAQTQADKGVSDAAKVASDLAAANVIIGNNTNEIEVVKSTITTVNETLSGKVTALENKDIELAGSITGLDTSVKSHATTIGEHTSAITALQTRDTELAALIQGNTDTFANYSTTEQVNKAIDDKIAAIPDVDFTGYATETYVGNAIAALDLDNKFDAKVDKTAFETYKTETATLIGTKADASVLADYYTKTDADAEFMTESEVDARINALINAADPEGGKTITDIQNLVKYVEENAGEIAGLVTTVDGHTTTIAEHTTAIANNKSAHEANASAIQALQTTAGEHTTAIKKNADDITAINTALAGIVQPKASEEVTVAADGTLGLGKVSTDKLEMGTNTLVIDGGSSAN